MGWSQRGNTRVRYQHYAENDAVEAMLIADGVVSPDAAKKKKDLLKPKICPNCEEPNKPDSRFCSKCRFVMRFDEWNETIQSAENTKKELAELKAKMDKIYMYFDRPPKVRIIVPKDGSPIKKIVNPKD